MLGSPVGGRLRPARWRLHQVYDGPTGRPHDWSAPDPYRAARRRSVTAGRWKASATIGEAAHGRRSRRFAFGDEIPDGPLAYRSQHEPVPLSGLERMLVLSAMGGTSGWHYAITRHERYAPHLSNYAAAAAGRTFPSAAGFHTAEFFFTDDSGLYFFPTRDAGALVDPPTEEVTPELMVERHGVRPRKLSEGRLYLPAQEPYLEGHNTWCVNVAGSLLVIPVADIAQHLIAVLCFLAQNGYAIYDDVNDRKIPGWRASARWWTSRSRSRLRSLSSMRSPRPPLGSPPPAMRECSCSRRWVSAAGCSMGSTASQCSGRQAIPTCQASVSASSRTSAGRRRMPPAVRASSRLTAHHTTPT